MNPKQEKRFWSADQKRFVYSLKGRGYPLSFSYIRMTYRATLRTENGGTTGYNSYKDRSFFCEACGLHYGKEKNYDFIYIVSVAVNHFIRNRI